MPPLSRNDLEEVLERTGALFSELKGQHLFITGGTGFFGIWLLETFLFANARLSLGAHVTVLTRRAEPFIRSFPHLATDSALTLHEGDVRSFATPDRRADFVIHAAAPSTGQRDATSPSAHFQTIVEGTRRVLDYAALGGARRVLFTSSGAVYGAVVEGAIPETHLGCPDPLNPRSAYAEAKRAAEMLCALASAEAGLEIVIARCFAFIGPHLPLDGTFAAGNFLRDALRGGPIVVAGNGATIRSYLYAADLANWLWTLLFRGRAGRAYNVGSPQPVTIKHLAKTISRTVGKSCKVEFETAVTAAHSQPRSSYYPAVGRASEELGLKVRVSLEEALARTAAWLRSTPPQLSQL